jgi:hypothetical protein
MLLTYRIGRYSCSPHAGHEAGGATNARILLANSKVPKFVCPICLLGRQKAGETFPRKSTPRALKEVRQQYPPVLWSFASMPMERTPTQCSIRVRGEGRDRRHQARERGVTQLATKLPRQ